VVRTRTRRLAASPLLAALGAVVAGCGGSSQEAVKGGPLAEPGVRMGEAAAMNLGQSGTYGAETVTNHGRETAVLDSISFVGRSEGLEILGPLVMHVRTKPRTPALVAGLIRRFPPPHRGAVLHPVAGFRIAPHRSWNDDIEILIGFRPHRKGVLYYRALKLHYHVGETRYVATYPDPLAVCVPYSFPLERCKPP
jgi:hypothetical protein